MSNALTAGNGSIQQAILDQLTLSRMDGYANPSVPVNGTVTRESIPRASAVSGGSPSTGVMLGAALPLYAGDVVTNLHMLTSSTGLTIGTNSDGHLWAALYSPQLTLMSQSADIGGSATWAANTWKQFALGTAQTITQPGLYYAFVMLALGTGGTPVAPLLRISNLNSVLTGAGASGQPAGQKAIGATAGSALTTTAPAGPLTLGATSSLLYVATS